VFIDGILLIKNLMKSKYSKSKNFPKPCTIISLKKTQLLEILLRESITCAVIGKLLVAVLVPSRSKA